MSLRRALTVRAVTAAYRASAKGAWSRMRMALADPARAQGERLRCFLRWNTDTAYGRAHGFAGITSLAQFQSRVPIIDYEQLAPWVERIAGGERGVLTGEPVRMLERSGGSTGAAKLIPYTASSLREVATAASAWLYDLFVKHPRLRRTRQYWSLSPVARARERTAGGIPIGLEDDTEYFGALERWGMQRLMAVPQGVARAPSFETWRAQTLAHLVAAEDLGLISVWSPTFLTVLMDAAKQHLDELLAALPPRHRARVLRRLDHAGAFTGEALWPDLSVLSTWGDGCAASFLPALQAYFPRTALQPKGLLATEGVVSIPFAGQTVAAVTAHLLEFIDLDAPGKTPLPVEALKAGGSYSPLLTTGAGLARYHLRDVVRCVGHAGRAPVLRFEGKLDRVSDLVGEKLHERQVEAALARATAATGVGYHFALIAPRRTPGPAYELFIEADGPGAEVERLADAIDQELRVCPHYAYARDLGQLGPIVATRVTRGWEAYSRHLMQAGQRAGDIKPAHFDARAGWDQAFCAPAVDGRS